MPLAAPSLRRRMACWLYEGFLVFAVAAVSAFVFSVLTDMRSGMAAQRPWLTAFIVAVLALYFVYCWRRGQTLAMKTWRIKVVDRRAQPLSRGRALLRFAFCWVWAAVPVAAYATGQVTLPTTGWIAAGWVAAWAALSRLHPQRQFWHDAWAGTRLVEAD